MLPFLEPKKTVSVIMARRGKTDVEANPEVEAPGGEIAPALKEAAVDVMRALDTKSVIDLAKALQAAIAACEEAPHVEGEHLGEDEASEGEE